MNNDKVELFIKELRESADAMYVIFTQGSCFKLYRILKVIFKDAKAYWSDSDGHCIIKIEDNFYDIGGVINQEYVKDSGYYKIPDNQLKGFSLMKYSENAEYKPSVRVEKYKTNKESK